MWVARDNDGTLKCFTKTPRRLGVSWCVDDNVCGYSVRIDSNLYPYLRWEDEPIEVELWSKYYWVRTIDDIIHMYITRQESGEYGCVNDIVNSIIKDICG